MATRRILLSAFACAPDWGSEPGVGWRWAQVLARRCPEHPVTVLTHERFRTRIEAAREAMPMPGLEFCYLGRPGPEDQLQKQVDSHLHYLRWQWAARPVVRRMLADRPFALVHHLTWGSWRLPSFLGGLGVPLVIGPVGGGDDAPGHWMHGWPLAERARYTARSLWTASGRLDPVARYALSQARLILAKTEATRLSLPARVRPRTRLALELGCAPAVPDLQAPPTALTAFSAQRPLRLLYAGRLLGGKGVTYAVDSTLALAARGLPVQLHVVGQGRLDAWLQSRVAASATPGAVRLEPPRPFREMAALYREHDALLFPSWHDSSGNVVVEALSAGLPVVCLDRAGPAAITDARCALRVCTQGLDSAGLVRALGAAIESLVRSPQDLARLRSGALVRAAELQWDAQVQRAYAQIEAALGWTACSAPATAEQAVVAG